jgi:hypothetical protein
MKFEGATVTRISAVAAVGIVILLGVVFLYWQPNQSRRGTEAECVLERYVVFFGGTNTVNGQSFVTYTDFTTFLTTLAESEPAGYATSTSIQFTGTLTAAINSWNSTICTVR